MSLDELKLPKENLFKFTCRDHHNSANYTFTWELTPEGLDTLQSKGIRFPFMYVFAVEEVPPNRTKDHLEGCGCSNCAGHNRVVAQELFCLHEGAGQLQFHRAGEFRIYAMVIWDSGFSDPTWKSHRSHVEARLDWWSDSITKEEIFLKGQTLPNVVEDAVHIGNSFFAKPPNPTLWWWANLWFDTKPDNTCEYKKRLWFKPGLLIQVPIVSVYVLLRAVSMFLAFLGSMIVAFRPNHVHWRPMFHAFSSTWGQMFDFKEDKSNWAFRAKDSEENRGVIGIIIRMPFVWVGAPIGLYLLIRSVVHNPRVWVGVVISFVLLVALVVGLVKIQSLLRSRSRSVPLYYEVVPIEKPKKRRVPLKVRWLDAKGQMCLPYPK